jgi:hypothetical protein
MIKILRIRIVQTVDCGIAVTGHKELEKFRRDLEKQAKLGIAEDEIHVDFIIEEPKIKTI